MALILGSAHDAFPWGWGMNLSHSVKQPPGHQSWVLVERSKIDSSLIHDSTFQSLISCSTYNFPTLALLYINCIISEINMINTYY